LKHKSEKIIQNGRGVGILGRVDRQLGVQNPVYDEGKQVFQLFQKRHGLKVFWKIMS